MSRVCVTGLGPEAGSVMGRMSTSEREGSADPNMIDPPSGSRRSAGKRRRARPSYCCDADGLDLWPLQLLSKLRNELWTFEADKRELRVEG
jgi:hypothetical protein